MLRYDNKYREQGQQNKLPALRKQKQDRQKMPTNNTNTRRTELKSLLKTEGVKAVKDIAKQVGIEKPKHLGRQVVSQVLVKEALDQVQTETQQMIDDLGLSLVIKGKLISVFDAEGEYVAHGHAWGAVALKLKAWEAKE